MNMLAMEEKKTEALTDRLETTKMMMLNKGLTEEKLKSLLTPGKKSVEIASS